MDAAMTQVVDFGFAAFSMNRLAASLDYTPGALYRYFDSKEALLAKLVLRVIDEMKTETSPAANLGALETVVALCQGYRRFAASRPERFGVIALLLAAPNSVLTAPEHSIPAAVAMLASLSPLADALEQAADEELLSSGDARTRALVLFASLHGVLSLHKQAAFAPGIIDIDRMAKETVDTLLRGWGKKA